MDAQIPSTQLAGYLRKIERVFDVEALLRQDVDREFVVDYYTQSAPGYRRFHSSEGAVHMALNPDGAFDEEGFYGQARIVQSHIEELRPTAVLELASGNGFNSRYLARGNPDIRFVGVDLTPAHIATARAEAGDLPNLSFDEGNFQALPFDSARFDLVFCVESLCHASDPQLSLSEAYRVLRPGGRLIVFDGYKQPGFHTLDSDLQRAAKLVEISMAVGAFLEIDQWLDIARGVGFSVLDVDDLSREIIPTLRKQQRLALKYFTMPSLMRRAIRRKVPPLLERNSIAGLLMPLTVGAGAQRYYGITLVRPAVG